MNGGATDAYGYEVVLSVRHRLPARKQVAFSSYMEPVPTALRFVDDNTLEIRLEGGRKLAVTIDEETLEVDRHFRFYRGELQSE